MGFFDFDNMLSHSLQRLNPSESFLKFFIVLNLFLVAFSSNATDYYVSNNGNDSNSGTSPDQAWKTLDKVNSFTPSPGDEILFKRGDEWTGTVKVNASGKLGSNIIYSAYGSGSKPKIYGSEIISGWTKHSGNIYKAQCNRDITQLFIDDTKITLARYPNRGYFKIKSTNGKSYLSSNDLNQSINYTGANIFVRTKAWAIETETVSFQSGNTLNVSSGYYRYDSGEGFFLNNKLEFLDEGGEWYYDSSTDTVYLWTDNGESPANYEIRGSTIDDGITGSSVNFIEIDGLDIRHQGHNSIHFNNCEYVTINNNMIYSPGKGGILIDGGKSNNATITNNLIAGAIEYGVQVYGSDHIISDNIVKNIGVIQNVGTTGFGHSNGMIGIYVLSENTLVSYNNLSNIGYIGIRLSFAPNCLVENNYIYNSCFQKDDGGAIYTWNTDLTDPGCEGSVIKNNIIDYVPGAIEGYNIGRGVSYGIYLDEFTHDVNVVGNTVARTSAGGIMLHFGANCEVKDNLLFDGRFGVYSQSGDSTGNIISNNIIYSLRMDMNDYVRQHLIGETYGARAIYDSNTYVNHYISSKIYRQDSARYSFSEWKLLTGQDANSTFDHLANTKEMSEKLFYNATKQPMVMSLGIDSYSDVYGNTKSNKIILEPFTSIILLGKQFESINQQPNIPDYYFNILSPMNMNEVMGQLQATDLDINQSLSFKIIEGNETNLLSIDSKTGEITTLREIRHQKNQVIELIVEVKDNGLYSLSDTARIIITINIPDTSPPGIVLFNIPDTANTLTVSISNFIATDNAIVQGYLVSETSKTPDINSTEWLNSPHTSYTFQEEGKKHLYAWAIDSSGNISNAYAATVNIIIPDTIEIFNEVIICEGQDYSGWTEQGKYVQLKPINPDTIKKAVTNIIVKSPQLITEYISIKEGETYKGWENSGIYERTLTDVYGCDSIVTTNLTVLQPTYITEEIKICHGESYFEWEETGQYTRTLTALNKADSIVTTNLMVNPVYETEEEITIEEGENYNGWTESGEYRTVYTTSSGCDSIVTTHLIVQNIYSYYEWSTKEKYRRNNEKSVHKNIDSNIFQIYPNPAKSFLIIKHNLHLTEDSYIEINNYNGITLKEKKLDGRVSTKISLDNVPPGMYFIQLKTKQSHLIKKFIIN